MARGFQAMQQAVKNISTPKGGGGRRFNYFGLDDGESIIVRFLTDVDDIITCDFYEFVNVVMDGKATKQSFIVAPTLYEDDPDWVGEDWVVKYGGQSEDYNTKELGPPKPKERTVAIAVEREAVPVESVGGRPKFRYQDKIIDVTVTRDGKEQTYKGRNFILIRKDAKTFWGGVVGYYGEFGTLCDRDYKITRNGKQLATNFVTIPVGPAEEWEDLAAGVKEMQARYGYGTNVDEEGKELTKDSPDRFLYCPMSIDEWAEDQASEDRAKSLLTGTPKASAQARRAEPETTPKGDPWAGSSDQPAPPADASEAGELSALRARLESHSKQEATT